MAQPPRSIWWATLGLGLLAAYLLIIFLLGSEAFGPRIRARHLLVVFAGGFVVLPGLLCWAFSREILSRSSLRLLAVGSLAAVAGLLSVDLVSTARRTASVERGFAGSDRELDAFVWLDRSLPPKYYPTEKNFLLYKPNVVQRADVHGAGYSTALRLSGAEAKQALERRRIEFRIDENGFRNTIAPESAEIFALGDGLTAGMFTNAEDLWVERLAARIGEPIYNIGVGGSTPKQQLLLLEHLLATRSEEFRVRHLLWMINESGDLEGSYAVHGPGASRVDPLRDTIVATLRSLPDAIRDVMWTLKWQSLIHRWSQEEWLDWGPRSAVRRHWVSEGVLLHRPLYRSERFGDRLFDAVLIERALTTEAYVLDHPNRPLLDRTFEDMRALSEEKGFRVTVLIAPNSVRLYGPYFEDLPAISERPHVIDYVEKLATSQGFETINLYPLMKPHAADELLIWRDDAHWNPRGEELVAELVAQRLRPR